MTYKKFELTDAKGPGYGRGMPAPKLVFTNNSHRPGTSMAAKGNGTAVLYSNVILREIEPTIFYRTTTKIERAAHAKYLIEFGWRDCDIYKWLRMPVACFYSLKRGKTYKTVLPKIPPQLAIDK